MKHYLYTILIAVSMSIRVGATQFGDIPASQVIGTLTKTDDTNVTLTLGGTPTNALLKATSLTLGWTGQLSLARGGTGVSLSDPGANTLVGWDDTDNAVAFLTIGSGLTYTHGTHTLAASGTVTPAAMTKTDDTNVTLTLGGTPATSLLQATSLTLGWTGQLALSRGGTAANLTDPAADTIMGWDDTDNAVKFLTIGSGITYTHATHTLSVSSGVTPAALTKTDDTNVTLTLGGTPSTALLQASSLTLGWTGQLALTRGGTAANLSDPGADVLWGWDDTDNAIKFITVGTGLTYTHGTHTLAASATAQTHTVTFVVDGSGSVLSTGTKNAIKIPYGGTLTGWLLNGSPSGSVTVDIFRSADGAGLPVTSIVGGSGTKPALSSATENSSTSFTSWTSTTLTAKDNLTVSLSGVTTATYCALTLYYQ